MRDAAWKTALLIGAGLLAIGLAWLWRLASSRPEPVPSNYYTGYFVPKSQKRVNPR